MNAFSKATSAGFTLTEVMVVVVVLGILATMAVPSFMQMLRNSEISAAAESVANGLQRARAEAVTRNARVQFVLGSGTAWTVDYVSKPVSTDPPLDSRLSSESRNATLTATPAGTTTVTFNQLGTVWVNPGPTCPGLKNQDCSDPITQIDFNATGGYRSLRVTIGAGGNARVCDPSLPSSNVRGC
jgi:type IV fimbrial biogenesis protein FimT